ncbi:MAG: NAD(P)-binding protein [Labilithrix sp.]
MKSRFSKLVVRSRLAIRQNRVAIAFVVMWLVANTFLFAKVLSLSTIEAAKVALCMAKMPGGWIGAYQGFTEVVVFGLVASVVLSNVTSKYQPVTTCRALAESARGHVVVIGWTNLGERVVEMAHQAGRTAVVVEEDDDLVADLVREEEPLVIGSPRDRRALEAAGVAHARVVVIADDDLENAAVACRLVRELNGDCQLVVRCADADIGDVLARTYRAKAISTSRLAAEFIQAHAVRLRAKNVVVFGANDVGQRAAAALTDKRIPVKYFESTSDPQALAAAGVAEADLVVLCEDDLGDNLIRVDRIRDLNKRTRIVCRAFHEDAAEILTRAPFECTVLSTSRNAAESLARAGVFRDIGIEGPEARVTRALAPAT